MIAQAYVNLIVKCLADILLCLNIILRQIAFLFILLMWSGLRTEYRTTWSNTCIQGCQIKAMLLWKLELRTLFLYIWHMCNITTWSMIKNIPHASISLTYCVYSFVYYVFWQAKVHLIYPWNSMQSIVFLKRHSIVIVGSCRTVDAMSLCQLP
jgi:hypothetical protein